MILTLPLHALTIDADCQTRASIDHETALDYAERMKEGATFPPIIVFDDGAVKRIADGFHRFASVKALAREQSEEATATVECDVRPGSKLDAVRFAMSANARHGKHREPADYVRGYETAVRLELLEAHDTAAVAALLACSDRWARELTRKAREQRDAEQRVRITEMKERGISNRAIAREVGVSHQTIGRESGPKRQSSDLDHSATPARADASRVREVFARIERPESLRWSNVMTAMERLSDALAEAEAYRIAGVIYPQLRNLNVRLEARLRAIRWEIDDEAA